MIDIRTISTTPPDDFKKESAEEQTKKIVDKIGKLSRIFEAEKETFIVNNSARYG